MNHLFHRRRMESEMDEEFRSHLALRTADLERRGVPKVEAERQARIEFGGYQNYKEECREALGTRLLQEFFADVRYGLRQLRRNPGFTAVAILTLALGIGANTAIFTVVNSVLFHPLPVRNPSQLVMLRWTARQAPKVSDASSFGDCDEGFGNRGGCALPYPVFESLSSQAGLFSGVTAFAGPAHLVLNGAGAARMTRAELVSGGYFSTLGVKPAVGRVLGPTDDSPSASAAIVLSYAFWQSAFGGDRSVLGRTVRLNTAPFTIVGVAEPSFASLTPGKAADFFLTLAMIPRLNIGWAHDFESSGNWWLVIVARLNRGVTPARAQAAASLIFRDQTLHGGKPLWKPADDPALMVVPVQEGLNGVRSGVSTPLYFLMAIVGFILLIACANVAGLLLSRASARQQEMAVRVVLGAGRRRVVRQLLTESVLLSLAGGALGALLAVWGVRALMPLLLNNPGEPLSFTVEPDWRVLAFTIGISLLAGILFGLAPAFRSTRADLTPVLKETNSTFLGKKIHRRRPFHFAESLVVVQVALSMIVLVGAGLLVRTLRNLHSVDPGFDTRNVLMFGLDPQMELYKEPQVQNLYREMRGRLAALPGVISVSYSSDGLLTGNVSSSAVRIEGHPANAKFEVNMLDTGPDFFKTLRIPLLAGRLFTAEDFQLASDAAATEAPVRESSRPKTTTLGPPVPVIVNRVFTRRFFAGQNPLGKHLGHAASGEGSAAEIGRTRGWEIVGMVGDAKYDGLREAVQPTVYFPMSGGGAEFELRTASNPGAFIPAVRDVANRLDSNVPLVGVQTQSEVIEDGNAQERMIAQLSSFFGAIALALACVGLYGLLSYEVRRRTREIGIRMVLGAERHDATRLIIFQGVSLTLAGALIGVAGGLAVSRFLSSLLYGVEPTDPLTFIIVSLILIAVALLACYIPARRAAKVDPMVALRYQ
ncbi:MAG TPA: ABC transporter permease [Terriglobia bacterium]|nr:ABC transporter permease [Terriglobia bacterium]